MSSSFGTALKLQIFGQSHAPAIGMTLDGFPVGFAPDMEALQTFLNRRAPGQGAYATARKEADAPEFVSGLVEGHTCGAPLCAIIRNSDTRSKDYGNIARSPRPSHADFTAHVKYGGFEDISGGGHFSGRLTAPLCIAGGICIQILEQLGITIAAHIQSIENVPDSRFDPVNLTAEDLRQLLEKPFPVLNDAAARPMQDAILQARAECDSVGGIIECAAVGLPVGWGDPMFGGMENRIARMVFGIPAIRGIEFGLGFEAAKLRGSVHNDPWVMEGETVRSKTNRHGGVLGGITTGMPLIFRAAVKPTPSIAKEQDSISLSRGENAKLVVHGRHDPCIVPRAVPVMEAAAAIAIYDAYLCSL